MATKKTTPAKKTTQKVVKPATKSVSTQKTPAKSPAKKPAAKPAAKAPAKKVEAKKPVAKAPAKKPAAKAPAKPAPTKKPAPKAPAKPVAKKPEPKKPNPVKKAEVKAPAKPAAKKPAAKPEEKAPVAEAPKAEGAKKPVTGMRTPTPLTPKYGLIHPKNDGKKSGSVRHITRTQLKDADLEEFKQRLLAEREKKVRLQMAMSNDALSRPDEENVEEDGSNSANRADMLTRAEETRKSLLAIDDALRAIENKTYGICSVCHCAISRDRLRAAPFAIRCVKCKEEYERQVKASKRSLNL
jgi:RNA polymerase-binding transcription factor DksA